MSRAPRRAAGAGVTGDGRAAPGSAPDDASAPHTVAVRVKPGSARATVGGRHDGPYGPALIVAVNAPAVDGRATESARRALAEALELRPAAVTLRAGAASRDKLFTIAGADAALDGRLRRLRDGSAQ
ncbi:DUF167 domain-containing protein [Micromonospora sp. NPDC049679]|uniref:DUF167 domain-containing protein n=1 Tax=Micromonospora sp. NPDC049679 TaxID=3155920 RepID=UPI0033F25996